MSYYVDCLCGRAITTPTPTVTCPDCRRLLVLEWGGQAVIVPNAPSAAAEPPAASAGGIPSR